MRRYSRMCAGVLQTLLVGIVSAIVFAAGLVVLSATFSPGDDEVEPLGAESGVEAQLADGAGEFQGVPVLCYHYLRPRTSPQEFVKILGALFLNLPLLEDMDIWTQSVDVFEAQMAYLKRKGYETIDLTDVVEWRRGLRRLPPKPIVITFDDGDRSVLEHALPVLEAHGFKATLFVVTSRVGRKWDRVDCLDWDELRRLRESGVFSIQSHSHDLHRKVKTEEGDLPVFVGARLGLHEMPGGGTWAEAIGRDLRTSKRLIEQYVGGRVTCLAWPYGFGDAALDSVAVSAGYSVLCTLREGANRPPSLEGPAGGPRYHPSEVLRYTMTARTSLRAFEALLAESPRFCE